MSQEDTQTSSSQEECRKIKQDWYQTQTEVVLVLLIKNVDQSKVDINFMENSLSIAFEISENEQFSKCVNLSHKICPSKCSFKVFSTKIEIKMSKAEGLHWKELEVEKEKVEPKINLNKWDKVVSEIEEEEPQEEAALNALFQKIYNEGSDDVKKAMTKSFVESGGTELNTNWSAVKKGRVTIKESEGTEWKYWDV